MFILSISADVVATLSIFVSYQCKKGSHFFSRNRSLNLISEFFYVEAWKLSDVSLFSVHLSLKSFQDLTIAAMCNHLYSCLENSRDGGAVGRETAAVRVGHDFFLTCSYRFRTRSYIFTFWAH